MKKKTADLVIDLETGGTALNSVIYSLGASTLIDGVIEPFMYERAGTTSGINAHRLIDGATYIWWRDRDKVSQEAFDEIFGHEQTARVTKHHEFDDTMLEVRRREWARLLPAARQEIVTIRAIGQFPILMHAQSVIRVCQRDGLARGFLGRNTGLSLSSPDETLDQVLRPPTGLPPVKCQFMPSDRIGEHNTFFYFSDRT